mmetsp:Transcript_59003/g.182952  ORF Transcript_59003/g.182952 Transcript_59003/m.182952 type:complete len:201 (+) Transcript_59003:245-847(+)
MKATRQTALRRPPATSELPSWASRLRAADCRGRLCVQRPLRRRDLSRPEKLQAVQALVARAHEEKALGRDGRRERLRTECRLRDDLRRARPSARQPGDQQPPGGGHGGGVLLAGQRERAGRGHGAGAEVQGPEAGAIRRRQAAEAAVVAGDQQAADGLRGGGEDGAPRVEAPKLAAVLECQRGDPAVHSGRDGAPGAAAP